MTNEMTSMRCDLLEVGVAADHAARAVPPVWPLASSVAVNPFLGQTGESLAQRCPLGAGGGYLRHHAA